MEVVSGGKPGIRGGLVDFMSLTRTPFAFTQTLFVVLGFVYAGGSDWGRLFLGALSLSPLLLYGGIYILNDVSDREFDRVHPRKKQRVVPSERISVSAAVSLAAALVALGLGAALWVGHMFALACVSVFVNNLLYSFGPRLKNRLYLGLLSCSLNYPLRFLAGSSIVSLGGGEAAPALLLMAIALNGFSAYRVSDIRSMPGRMDEKKAGQEFWLLVLIRFTALAAASLTVVMLLDRAVAAALAVAAYMLFFSEVNVRVVKRGIDFFKLLRVGRTLRETPNLAYYPAMTAALAAAVVYVVVAAA